MSVLYIIKLTHNGQYQIEYLRFLHFSVIIMEWLFGRRLTPDEMLRNNQRALNKAMRDLDREKMKMEQQEKKVIADIKKLAKDGQMVNKCIILFVGQIIFLNRISIFRTQSK